MARWVFAFSLLGSALLLGCGAHDETAEPSQDSAALEEAGYVGDVAGTDIRVGIATRNGKADVFFCGGANSLAKTKWFRGLTFPLEQPFEKDGFSTTVMHEQNRARGTLVFPDGSSHEWTASKVESSGLAGLYDVKDDEGVGGVVVMSQNDAQGAFLFKNAGVEVRQIIVVRPISKIGAGIPITVDARSLTASRVQPAL